MAEAACGFLAEGFPDGDEAIGAQGAGSSLHELTILVAVEMVNDGGHENQVVGPFSEIVGEPVASAMDDAITHILGRENRSGMDDRLRQFQDD